VAKAQSNKLPSEERSYRRTRFSVEVVREAVKVFDQQINPDGNLEPVLDMYLYITEDLRRDYVNEEEFFADYITVSDSAHSVSDSAHYLGNSASETAIRGCCEFGQLLLLPRSKMSVSPLKWKPKNHLKLRQS
jgi:hypothetical protein